LELIKELYHDARPNKSHDMGSLETREVSCPFRELNHDSLADHSVALHRANTWLKCWRRSSSCWLSVQEDSSQEFGAVKSPRQLAVDLQLQQGGVGQGRTDISSVGKPLPTYFSPPNVRSMSNTNHFHRMLCDILVACPCVRYPWTVMSSSKTNTGIFYTTVKRLPSCVFPNLRCMDFRALHRLEFLSEN
jgi:hypothetical protein